MLAFFRRAFKSWVVLLVLGLAAIAVVVTGVGTPSGLGLGAAGADGGGEVVATAGADKIRAPDVARRAEAALDAARQQQPNADMAALVAQGGVEATVDQLLGARAVELWAQRHGFVASKKLVDGEIASIPAFFGPGTGKFDETAFRAALQQAKIAEPQLRRDIAGDALRRMVIGPIGGGSQAPLGLVTPYASLLLERRQGLVGFVPADAMPPGAAPTDAELAGWYAKHVAAYSLPERRVLRYAMIGPDQAKAAPPTDAETAAYYQQHAADYAAKESRTLSQLTLPTEAAARAASAKIKGGASFDATAQAAGFAPADTAIGKLDRPALAARSGDAVAAAAYALAEHGVSDPVRSSIGWAIVRVDGITRTPARTLEQVRAEVFGKLAAQKREAAFADLVAAVQDALDKGGTFDEVARAKGLTPAQTPAITAAGAAPGVAGWAPPPFLGAVLRPAFDASADDPASVEQLGAGGAILLKVASIVPAAPVPLAQVRAEVARDVLRDRAVTRARQMADAIQAKVNAGTPLAQALAASGVRLPPPQPINARQADLARSTAPVPAALTMLFGMKAGSAKIAPAPDGRGWFVVQLATIERGDATGQPQLVQLTRREFARILGDEYAQQFGNAVQREVGTTRDPAAIARLRTALRTGQTVQ